MKRCTETGSPWRVLLSRLKYWVAVPQFLTHNSWSFNEISIQVINSFPKPNFFTKEIRKLRSIESKAFFNIHSYIVIFFIYIVYPGIFLNELDDRLSLWNTYGCLCETLKVLIWKAMDTFHKRNFQFFSESFVKFFC